MKTVMTILIVLVAAVVGAGGTFFMLRGGVKNTAIKPAEAAEPPAQTLMLDERTVNLADTSESRYLRVTLALEVTGTGKAEELEKEHKPKLLDGLIEVASKHTFKSLLRAEGKQTLRQELLDAFNKALQKNGWKVKEVLYTDFVME